MTFDEKLQEIEDVLQKYIKSAVDLWLLHSGNHSVPEMSEYYGMQRSWIHTKIADHFGVTREVLTACIDKDFDGYKERYGFTYKFSLVDRYHDVLAHADKAKAFDIFMDIYEHTVDNLRKVWEFNGKT